MPEWVCFSQHLEGVVIRMEVTETGAQDNCLCHIHIGKQGVMNKRLSPASFLFYFAVLDAIPHSGWVFQLRWPNLTNLYQIGPEPHLLGDCRSCQPENNEPTHTVDSLQLEDGLQNSGDPWPPFHFNLFLNVFVEIHIVIDSCAYIDYS